MITIRLPDGAGVPFYKKKIMRSFIRTSLLWFLTLSLIGLPAVVMADNAGNVAWKFVQNDEVSESRQMNASSQERIADSGMHCHEVKTGQINQHADVKSEQAAENIVAASSHEKCCCDNDCQCSAAVSCHSTDSLTIFGILESIPLVHSSVQVKTITESVAFYHDCDIAAERIPPIV